MQHSVLSASHAPRWSSRASDRPMWWCTVHHLHALLDGCRHRCTIFLHVGVLVGCCSLLAHGPVGELKTVLRCWHSTLRPDSHLLCCWFLCGVQGFICRDQHHRELVWGAEVGAGDCFTCLSDVAVGQVQSVRASCGKIHILVELGKSCFHICLIEIPCNNKNTFRLFIRWSNTTRSGPPVY